MTETQVAVIIERLDNVIEKIADLDERHETKLSSIETQAKATNGRVTDLERWKSYILGAVAMVTFLVGIVLPVALFILNRLF